MAYKLHMRKLFRQPKNITLWLSNNTRPIEQKSQYKPHYIRKISKMSETEIFQMLRIFDNNQT